MSHSKASSHMEPFTPESALGTMLRHRLLLTCDDICIHCLIFNFLVCSVLIDCTIQWTFQDWAACLLRHGKQHSPTGPSLIQFSKHSKANNKNILEPGLACVFMPRRTLKHIKSQEAGGTLQSGGLPAWGLCFHIESPVVLLWLLRSALTFAVSTLASAGSAVAEAFQSLQSPGKLGTRKPVVSKPKLSWLPLSIIQSWMNDGSCFLLGNHCEYGMAQENALCYSTKAPKTCFSALALYDPRSFWPWVELHIVWLGMFVPPFQLLQMDTNGYKWMQTLSNLKPITYNTLPINWARQTLQAEFDAELC